MILSPGGAGRACALLASLLGPMLLGTNVARAASTEWVGDSHAAVRLVTASDHLGSGGSLAAGLEFRFSPGWHGYWRTPGDAGLPPMVDWSNSDNLDRADLSWPAPKRIVVEGLRNAAYEGHVLLPISAVLKKSGQPLSLKVAVGYAACSNICVPYQASLALDISTGNAAPSTEAPLIDEARAAVPGAPDKAGVTLHGATITGSGADRTLKVDLVSRGEPFGHPDLFVESSGGGLPPAPEVALSDDGRSARLTSRLGAGSSGPLVLTVVDGALRAELHVPGGAPAPSIVPPTLMAALASALFGGLILNLMPCVLPVLSLKLLAATRAAGQARGAMRLSFAATALGIVVSFLALAAILVGLKAFGATLGWGIQFQQPWFLAMMASLTVLFALSLFDRLPIGISSRLATALPTGSYGSWSGAFLTGAFATLLATPCSAPFVGTAVGFALAGGVPDILAIFLALGIGMAAPYWIAALVPAFARLLPRPGPWMPALRRVLGLLLFGTAAWLLAVLWSVAGIATAAVVAMALLGLAALQLWWQPDETRTSSRALRWAAAVLAIVPVLAAAALPASLARPPSGAPGWAAFDPEAVPALVAQGKTVLIDVTASWCLTCKVNDISSLGRPEVEARLANPNVVRMRADWSRPDPAITAYLRDFARYGIPFDIVYGPGAPAGEPLPELLTPRIVTEALDHAAGA